MYRFKYWQSITRYCAAFCLALSVGGNIALASTATTTEQQARWQQLEKAGRNQSVYFYAWGGDAQINAYIQWVAQQLKVLYNIDLVHVKLSDTSEAVSRVLAEKSASNDNQGSVDLIWINGANFATMREHALLHKDWAYQLPNFSLTDPDNNPAVIFDFGIATQGMEAPWGQASLTFYYDSLTLDGSPNNQRPTTLAELLSWSTDNPGRFGYPKPPDFLGMSFLKYALVTLHQHSDEQIRAQLKQPVTAHNQAAVLNPLWDFLNTLHPTLWRSGQSFMHSGAHMRRLVDDTEISLAFTFLAPEIPAAVERFDLPSSIRSYAMDDGSLSNTHFVAIPYNASHPQGAQLVANFLLSPQAQAHKQKTHIWGDKSVLIQSMLNAEQQALFKSQAAHPSALPLNSIKRTLSEPHPSWVEAIMQGWQTRYGVTQ